MKLVFILLTVACFCHVTATQSHDVDERTTKALLCEHFHYNNRGYTCGCHRGYSLADDRRSCSDINECKTRTHECAQICINNIGSYTCASCIQGYSVAHYDSESCTDVDECATTTHGCHQLCNNNHGSYICDCRPGYRLAYDNKSCTDVDECATSTHGCNQLCTNNHGSYTCDCGPGYSLAQNGKSCIDVDECATTTHVCDHFCTNNNGSFRCGCRSGYRLSQYGKWCFDIDECATTTHGCHQLCNNYIGSFTCVCRQGYKLARNGKSCDDVDECTDGTSGCAHSCRNSIGSYACGCRPGYTLAPNGHSCIDVDECARRTPVCDEVCDNNMGSYTCGCRPGYSLWQDGKSCFDGPHDVNVTEGESVTFNCNPSDESEVKISWLLNAHPIRAENPPARYVFSNDKKSLTIRDVCRECVDQESRTDETVIQCNASNVHGYTIASGIINILMKTKVTINGSKEVSVDFLEEKQFVFQCHVTSDPSTPPTVRWYKTKPYGDLVRSEPPYVNVTNEFLIITPAPNCSDECVKYLGEYKCVGDNGYSHDNQTITLHYINPSLQALFLSLAIGGTSALLLILIVVIAVVACISIRRSRAGEDRRSHKAHTPPTTPRDAASTGVYGVVIPNANDPVRYALEKTPNPTIYAELDLASSTVYGVVVPNAGDRGRSPLEMAPNSTIYAELDLVPTRDTHGRAVMESEYDNVKNLESVYSNNANTKV